MPKNSITSFIKSIFRKKPTVFARFRDPLGNFEISYPDNWKFDKDIAVVDGKYSICFESGNSHFTVSVDAAIPEELDFKKYAQDELESPSSGILASMEKTDFRGMSAYGRKYCYSSGGKEHFGKDLIFFTGKRIFMISWNALENERADKEKIFAKMLTSIALGEGLLIEQ